MRRHGIEDRHVRRDQLHADGRIINLRPLKLFGQMDEFSPGSAPAELC
jgi:hypothetical protein